MSEYNRNSSGGRNFEHRGLEGGTLSSYNRAGHSSTGHRSSSGTSSHTKSTAAHTSTGRRDTAMNRAAAGRSGHTSGRYKKKRRNRLDITQILLIVIGVLAVILIAAIASRGCGGGSAAGGATESDAVQESTVADGEVTVNGVNIYGMTQEDAALRLGKTQSTIANKLRLLRFTDVERRLMIGANLTERQARALIRIADDGKRIKALEKVAARGLNLEQTEALVNEILDGTEKQEKKLREDKFKRLFPKPPKLYMNSINKLIRQMKDADIPCVTSSGAVDGYYEYIIRFPMAE